MNKAVNMRRIMISAGLVLAATSMPSLAADTVKLGMIGSVGDAPIYYALDKGYFADVGINLQLEPMGSLAKQIAPLSTGELDAGCGAISAGLYNAVNRAIPMKVVADKGRNAPGYGYNSIIVRKDLVDSGAVKTLADLKGRTIATIGVGSTDMSILNEAMKTVGLSYDDIKQTSLTLPNHLIALENKGIEATLTPEPVATMILDKGIGVRLATVDRFYPDQQQTVIVFSNKFMKDRPEVAERFMVAYLRGVRAYMDTLKDGLIAGKGADDVIASIMNHTGPKDAALLKRIFPVVIDPNGEVNLASMKKDWEFLKSKGLIDKTTTPEDIVDMSYVQAAVKKLGPYKKS
jgi:NitT/TauT family transport system substrate-binding protein